MNESYSTIVDDSTKIAITINLTLLVVFNNFFLKTVRKTYHVVIKVTPDHRNIQVFYRNHLMHK